MTTVRDLIQGSFRLIGVYASGETPQPSEMQDALKTLNAMLGEWNNQRYMAYTINANTFALTIGQQNYTLGTGGDFNMARPVRIENASILVPNGTQPMELPIPLVDDDQWQQVTVKNVPSAFPTLVYPLGNYPLNTLKFWPIPSAPCSVVLYTWNRVAPFTSINDSFTFPDGYEKAIKYGLAVELAPEYGKEAPPTVLQMAQRAKGYLAAQNWEPTDLVVDQSLLKQNGLLRAIRSFGYVVD